MLRRMMKGLKKQEGFTLLEVLVVIAILGIIAALITPRFLNVMRDARVDTVRASGKQIQMGMERFNFTNNRYPTTGAAGEIVTGAEYAGLVARIGNTVALPADPADAPFIVDQYTSATPNSTYELILVVRNADTDAGDQQCVAITPRDVVTGTLNDGVAPHTCN